MSTGGAFFNKNNGNLIVSRGIGVEEDTLVIDGRLGAPIYHLGAGYRWLTQKKAVGSNAWFMPKEVLFGADFYYSNSRKIHGDVYQYGSPDLDNYKFKLSSNLSRLMLSSRAFFTIPQSDIEPYLLIGLGDAWNKVSKYEEIADPLIGGGTVSYANHTRDNFAYQLGGGLSYPFAKNWQFYTEYSYADLGYLQAGTSHDGDTTTSLQGAKLPAHDQEFFIGLRHNF